MDPRRAAELDAAHAKKLAARASSPHNVQSYPATAPGRYQAKLEARIEAFNAPKSDAKPAVSEAEALAVLEAATKPEPRAARSARG